MGNVRHTRKTGAVIAVGLVSVAAAMALLLGSRGGEVEELTKGAKQTAAHSGVCSTTVTSLSAVQSAVGGAAPGSTVCLASGSYDELDLDADPAGGGITVRAENPGKTTIAGADLSGSNLALARFNVAGEVTIEPGSRRISVLDNRITGGYMGINAGPTTSESI